MIDAAAFRPLLADFLPRQRWYADVQRPLRVEIVDFDVWRDEWPGLLWALAEVDLGASGSATYQLNVGLRPLAEPERFLEGKGRWLLGDIETDSGPALAYDALVDPTLSLAVLNRVAPDHPAERVRPLTVEQSNTSVVFDERLIMKVFRRVQEGPNPDVEITEALGAIGFEHVSTPIASWGKDGRDLAVVRSYLQGSTDGWQLALTSLRDLYDSRLDPAECGGDFAPEARRLGETTAQLHLVLAAAFGATTGDPNAWVDGMLTHLDRVPTDQLDADGVRVAYERLRHVNDPGKAIRIHGDLHLGQMMRTDTGWIVLDFEGEPEVPLDERRRTSSPLRDVGGMFRSFHYATQSALVERGVEVDAQLAMFGRAWEERAASAFLDGYDAVNDVATLLPRSAASRRSVLDAFVLAKAVYEVGYEAVHRPEWIGIPLAAVRRSLNTRGVT